MVDIRRLIFTTILLLAEVFELLCLHLSSSTSPDQQNNSG